MERGIIMFTPIFRRLLRNATASVIAAASVVSCFPFLSVQAASGNCGTGAYWELNNNKLTIRGNGAVTTASWSTNSADIKEVVIEDGITALPSSSFMNYTALKSLTMANSVTQIGYSLCRGCNNLETIQLSSALTNIPDYSFCQCFALQNFTFPSGVTAIGTQAFYGCISMTEVILPESLKTIDYNAFIGNCLKTLKLNDGLESIGTAAFQISYLTSVVVPDSVTFIGKNAFEQIYDSVVIENGNPVGYTFGAKKYITIYGSRGSAAESYANAAGLTFKVADVGSHNCGGTWVVDIPASCESVGSRHFECAICGKTVMEDIPATGHSFNNWVVSRDATCTEEGEMARTCTACGVKEVKSIEAKGHSWSEWKVTKEPDFEHAGEESRTCSECYQTEKRELSKLSGYTIQATAGYGGSISPSGNLTFAEGESVTYSISPNDGYEISALWIDNVKVNAASSYTFTDIHSNHSISVDFSALVVEPSDVCVKITATPKKLYFDPSSNRFRSSDFSIIATVRSNGGNKEVEISSACSTSESPKQMYDRGIYGDSSVNFTYNGSNAAVRTYVEQNGISCPVVIALLGDGTLDAFVNAEDATLALRSYVVAMTGRKLSITDTQVMLMDVIADGNVDADDASRILRYYVSSIMGNPKGWDSVLK